MLTKTSRITNKVTRASKALRMPQPAKATHITRRGSKREGTAVSENLMVVKKIVAFLGKAEFNGDATEHQPSSLLCPHWPAGYIIAVSIFLD